MKSFDEPWCFIEDDKGRGQIYGSGHKIAIDVSRRDGERLCACVNFLAGIASEGEMIRAVDLLGSQRTTPAPEKVVAAMEMLREEWNDKFGLPPGYKG